MSLSHKLQILADWFSNPENEILVESESDSENLNKVAENFVLISELLKTAALDMEKESAKESALSLNSLMELAAVAEAFDESEDADLQKQASVLDELLLTIASPPGFVFSYKKAEDARIEELKKKYNGSKEKCEEYDGVKESLKALDDSKILESSGTDFKKILSTRTCPDHPGAQVTRVADGVYQCGMDKKIYDYNSGFKLMDGTQITGGSVSEQTIPQQDGDQMFDTREERLQK